MAVTSWRVPGAATNYGYAGSNGWGGSVSAIQTSNDVSMSATNSTKSASSSQHLRVTSFGFSAELPSNAVILGVEMTIECRSSTAGTTDNTIMLVYGSAGSSADHISSNKAFASWGTNTPDPIYTYGGSADVWGATLTAAIINDTSFGATILLNQGASAQTWIDQIRMRVYYTQLSIYYGAVGSALYKGALLAQTSLYYGANSLFSTWPTITGSALDTQTITNGNYSSGQYFGYYSSLFGSISTGTSALNGQAITGAFFYVAGSQVTLVISGGPTNWTTVTINGTAFNRASASFDGTSSWTWSSGTNPFTNTPGAAITMVFT